MVFVTVMLFHNTMGCAGLCFAGTSFQLFLSSAFNFHFAIITRRHAVLMPRLPRRFANPFIVTYPSVFSINATFVHGGVLSKVKQV